MANIKFEDKMNRLEEIVSSLEQENVSLDDALKLYEEGLTLSSSIKEELKKYEEKIEKINKEQA